MANYIKIPYDDGTTQTDVLFNADNIIDIQVNWSGGGNHFTLYFQAMGAPAGNAFVKSLVLSFVGAGATQTDIVQADVNNLKSAIAKNAMNPGNIAVWTPINYKLDPVRYSITSYRNDSAAANLI